MQPKQHTSSSCRTPAHTKSKGSDETQTQFKTESLLQTPFFLLLVLTGHGSYSDHQALHHGIQGEGGPQDGHALSNVLPHLLLQG